jgi:hypothetical protein
MGAKTWGKVGNPTWVGPARVIDRPAPLGANKPERHRDADDPVTRDDAPADAGVPEVLVVDRAQWLATGGTSAAGTPDDPGPHTVDGGHRQVTSVLDVDSERQLDFVHRDVGGHRPADVKGAGGAAHGGLRSDNAQPWANPEGYPLGTDYDPVNMLRPMPHGRMRGALRAIGEAWFPETGNKSSPPPAGRYTSPFDPAAQRRGFGPEPTTARHVLRPAGDEPRELVNFGTIGDGFMR